MGVRVIQIAAFGRTIVCADLYTLWRVGQCASMTAGEGTRNEEEPELDAEEEVTADASRPVEEQDKADLPGTRKLRPRKNIKPLEIYQDYSGN